MITDKRVRGLLLGLLFGPPAVATLCHAGHWEVLFPYYLPAMTSLCLATAALGYRLRRLGGPCLPGARALGCALLASVLVVLGADFELWGEPLQVMLPLMMTLGCLCGSFALLGRHFVWLWFPFLFIEAVQTFAFLRYGTDINVFVLSAMLETTTDECAAYLTPASACAAILGAGGIAVLLLWLRRCFRGQSRRAMLMMSLLGIGGALVFGAGLPGSRRLDAYFWPVTEVTRLGMALTGAFQGTAELHRMVDALPTPAAAPSRLPLLRGDEGVVLVLHIGESLRADRMSINGYERDTTPWLRRQEAVINFPACVSVACDTRQAQIAILTNARRATYDSDPAMQASTGSVLELFRKHDFRIYAFLGRRCAQVGQYDGVLRSLTRCAEARMHSPGAPWTALPQVQQVLSSNPNRNLLLLVDNEGSHTPFANYDAANPAFTPTRPSFENPAAHAEEVNNAYDNTVVYTDEFFRRMSELLRGRPFVYLYVGDHGEYLGHDGLWSRGGLGNSKLRYHDTTGCLVGMFILPSPEFAALHPEFTEALKRLRSHSGFTVGHEHIFHTLLGLVGLQTPHYREELDLCSPAARPYNGPCPPSLHARQQLHQPNKEDDQRDAQPHDD